MIPRHIAISLERDVTQWALKNSRDAKSTYDGRAMIVEELIESQVKLNIPVMTIYLLRQDENITDIEEILESIARLFEQLAGNATINRSQVRVSVFGKWYDLPSQPVERIKRVIEATATYDRFFLNFCIYYDGKEEIVDACRLIAMKVKADKLDPGAISSELIKENLYSSYFLAPDIVIINGEKNLSGFMLWDISEARIYFTNKEWPEFNAFDLKKAVDLFKLVGNKSN
jgi:undecaprenyl diphosphate synthase